jgi:hypothetical protein
MCRREQEAGQADKIGGRDLLTGCFVGLRGLKPVLDCYVTWERTVISKIRTSEQQEPSRCAQVVLKVWFAGVTGTKPTSLVHHSQTRSFKLLYLLDTSIFRTTAMFTNTSYTM